MQNAALVGGIFYCAADESGRVARFESWQFACHWKINALAESVSFWRLKLNCGSANPQGQAPGPCDDYERSRLSG